jgi:hypothetical protein
VIRGRYDRRPALDDPIPDDFNHLHFGAGQTEATVTLPPAMVPRRSRAPALGPRHRVHLRITGSLRFVLRLYMTGDSPANASHDYDLLASGPRTNVPIKRRNSCFSRYQPQEKLQSRYQRLGHRREDWAHASRTPRSVSESTASNHRVAVVNLSGSDHHANCSMPPLLIIIAA